RLVSDWSSDVCSSDLTFSRFLSGSLEAAERIVVALNRVRDGVYQVFRVRLFQLLLAEARRPDSSPPNAHRVGDRVLSKGDRRVRSEERRVGIGCVSRV